MKIFHVGRLTEAAKTRKAGYIEALNKVGKPMTRFGMNYLVVADADAGAIREQFATELSRAVRVPGAKFKTGWTKGMGLGDAVHAVAGPIGVGINKVLPGAIPCLKPDGTTDLRPDSPCAQKQAALNVLGKKVSGKVGSMMRRWRGAVPPPAKPLIVPPR